MEPAEERQHLLHRLQLLDAIAAAIDRRAEFLDLVADSTSADHARLRLQDEWGMSELQATAMLDLPARRFAQTERDRIVEERTWIERRVADALRSTLRADLVAAMKQRRPEVVSVLRSTLAAIDNAEAVQSVADAASAPSHHVAGANVGLASTEAERRDLTEDEVRAIVHAQLTERLEAADQFDAHGRTEAADRLRREADALRKYV